VSADGGTGWAFTVDGEKDSLADVGLVLMYKAGVA
jgi:hypothetical protein